jgi:hypothetical protein
MTESPVFSRLRYSPRDPPGRCENPRAIEKSLHETITLNKKHLGWGRQKADGFRTSAELREISFQLRRGTAAIDEILPPAGLRIYVRMPTPSDETGSKCSLTSRTVAVRAGLSPIQTGLPADAASQPPINREDQGPHVVLAAGSPNHLPDRVCRQRKPCSHPAQDHLQPLTRQPQNKTHPPPPRRGSLQSSRGCYLFIKQTPQRIRLRLVEELNPLQTNVVLTAGSAVPSPADGPGSQQV